MATVAIDGADNAALLAVQMLSLSDDGLAEKLQAHKEAMAAEVLRKNEKAAEKFAEQA